MSNQLKKEWLREMVLMEKKSIIMTLLISFLVSFLMLVPPLYSRFVYNTAIPSQSKEMLLHLAVGAFLVILFSFILRLLRTFIMSEVGHRVVIRTSAGITQKTLSLPYAVLGKSSPLTHINRLRDLERIREFMSGTLGVSLVELPFVAIFLVALWILGGALVLVPLVSIAVYLVVIPFFSRAILRASQESATKSTQLRELQFELAFRRNSLLISGRSDKWLERYYLLLGEVAQCSQKLTLINSLLSVVARTITSLSVLGTIALGISLVMNGQLTPGGLIAAMMIIYRVTSPLQAAALSASKLRQLQASTQQIERLITLEGENRSGESVDSVESLPATIKAERVVFRYSSDRLPALNGVSFEVKSGQRIAVIGPGGAGKSTLLQALYGIHRAQSGYVQVGGKNIRQLTQPQRQGLIVYIPEHPFMEYDTVREVLLEKSEEEINVLLTSLVAYEQLQRLPQGLDTTIQQVIACGERSFLNVLLQAQLILLSPKIILIDTTAGGGLGATSQGYLKILEQCRSDQLVLIATHSPQIIASCSDALVLDRGNVVQFGPIQKRENHE